MWSWSLPSLFGGEGKGWYDGLDLTGYTFPIPPPLPHSLHMAAGFEAPPLVQMATIPLPRTEEDGVAGLDVVLVPRSPVFGCW